MNAIALAVAMSVSLAGAPPKAKVQDLTWMTGAWSCSIWGGTFEEHWAKPKGGTMIGMGRLTQGDKTNFMEFLSIEPDNNGLTMWILLDAPSKGKKQAVPFKLTSLKGKTAVWENPGNDFPSKIAYTALGNGRMKCRISGKQGGKDAHEDFNFDRMK